MTHQTSSRIPAFKLLSLATLALFSTLSACTDQARVQGNKDTIATYHGRDLRANLAPEARVPAVIAAADQTLRARGYTVVRSSSTEEAGEIVAYPPRYNNYPRIVITSTRGVSSTVVDLRVEPLGDQELCRSVLDGILQRLGL